MTRPDFSDVRPDVAEYITSLENRIDDITQMLQNLQRLYFGKKSEKIRIPAMRDGAEQLSLFATEEPVPDPHHVEPEAVEVSGHKRKKKRTQEEIIADLPVIVHEHTVPENERRCPRCGNENLEYIGKELAYTEYVRVPAHVDRHEHYIEKYACHACENGTEACPACDHANPRRLVPYAPASRG